MNDQEIRRAFKAEMKSVRVSDGLTAHTIAQMEGERIVKKKLTGSLALALCLIMVFTAAAVAAASHAGLIDFMINKANTSIPDDTGTYIKQDLAVGTSEDGAFTAAVREAAFDGATLYTVIDITHKDGTAFFVHADSSIADPASDLSMAAGDDASTDGSILDMWNAAGKGTMYQVTANFSHEANGAGPHISCEGVRQEDGVYTLYTVSELAEPAAEQEFSIVVCLTPFADPEAGDETDVDSQVRIPVTFTIEASDIAEIISVFPETEIGSCGISIDNIQLSRAAFDTYMVITYTVTNEAAYAGTDGGVTFMAVNAEDKAIPSGARGSGYTECVSGEPGTTGAVYAANQTLYFEEMPDELILRVFNCWDKGEYETVTISIDDTGSSTATIGE